MFESYQQIANQYKKLPIKYERKLIRLAKKGESFVQNELLLHLIGFFLIRIRTVLYSFIVKKYGEDILQNCLLMATKNIQTYNLGYRNKTGKFHPVHLSTYMWKGTTGLILASAKKKKEICFSDLQDFHIKKYE